MKQTLNTLLFFLNQLHNLKHLKPVKQLIVNNGWTEMTEKHRSLSDVVFGVVFAVLIAEIANVALNWQYYTTSSLVTTAIILGIMFVKAIHYWEHYINFFARYPMIRWRHYFLDYTISLIGALAIIFATNVVVWFLLMALLHGFITLRCKATISKVKEKDRKTLNTYITDNYFYYLPFMFVSSIIVFFFGTSTIFSSSITVVDILVYVALILHIFRAYIWFMRD